VYRVSNRSNFQNATYRDHNGPNGTPPNANGFNALADLAGLSGTDTRDINPNERSGRFGAVAILCRDSDGGQLRGSMRYCRAANPRVGTHKLIRDRNADWHMLLPLRDAVDPDGQEITDEEIVLAIGPMPNAMVII
jgi:hypothetical protein